MNNCDKQDQQIRYLTPDNLYQQLKNFTAGMSVTKGCFELVVENCLVQDVEWNHMDQMHRPTIHNTYEKGIRIAFGNNFAFSLTQWGKWPFLIPVTDVYVGKGLFYQSLTIGGIIFLHSIISLEQVGENVKLKDEWFIASHKVFKIIHKFLDKKLYKLNKRLQDEDQPVRQGRLALRKKGLHFRTDVPDYYNSNILRSNTIYPQISENACLSLNDVTVQPQEKMVGNLEFVIKKDKDAYLIWPAACPHEGGPLIEGKFCGEKVACPWHGLEFAAAKLSLHSPSAIKQGFQYNLVDEKIFIKQINMLDFAMQKSAYETLENYS
jgi:nitrite reductase/ring-hydroxylating ferredoxin subunit